MKKIITSKAKGITLVALVVTIIVLLILAGVGLGMLNGENGIITRAKESSFRMDLKQVREKVDLDSLAFAISEEENAEIVMEPIPREEAEKWNITLKNELICWGGYDFEVNELTANYVKENFINIIKVDEDNNMKNLYYIQSTELKNKAYIYNQMSDIVYKVNVSKIGKYKVHSIEELDALKTDGIRGKVYKRIQYDVEYKTVGGKSYYEPDLNDLNEETTSLMFYKIENNIPVNEVYKMSATEWLNEGRINEKEIDNDKYVLYDYENKIWANIEINNVGISTVWTWIPRYAFKNNSQTTEVEFLKIEDNTPEGYTLTQTFSGNDKKGMWSSKYESTNKIQDITKFSYYIPDLSNFNKECTYICVYNETEQKWEKEVKASEVSNLATFSKNNLWFDYDKKIWANIKVVANGIETWWVWIPRYAVSNSNEVSDVIFIDINNKTLDGNELPNNYIIPESFKGNNKRGIWISKFEPAQAAKGVEEISILPVLEGFDKETTFLEIYDKEKNEFAKEVKYGSINDLKKFSEENLWYDYDNQIWANIKVVQNGIETWWVWIPRYAVNVNGENSDIVLIDKNNNPLDGTILSDSYKIVDTFAGNDKLGIWASKYVPSEH